MTRNQSPSGSGHIAEATNTTTQEDLERMGVGSLCAGIFKTFLAIPNNATWVAMGNALDQIRESPAYQQNRKLRYLISRVPQEWKQYENALIYAQRNRLFDPRDLTPESRAYYGDITPRQYYEFWQGSGFTAYRRSANHITALQHRYRKALLRQGETPDTDATAAALTIHALYSLCCTTFDNIVEDCNRRYHVPPRILELSFKGLNLHRLRDLWLLICKAYAPKFEVPSEDEDNILLGLQDIIDQWLTIQNIQNDELKTIKEYEEIFADKKQQRKMIKNLK